jgi:hypothetical protein
VNSVVRKAKPVSADLISIYRFEYVILNSEIVNINSECGYQYEFSSMQDGKNSASDNNRGIGRAGKGSAQYSRAIGGWRKIAASHH